MQHFACEWSNKKVKVLSQAGAQLPGRVLEEVLPVILKDKKTSFRPKADLTSPLSATFSQNRHSLVLNTVCADLLNPVVEQRGQ